MFYSVIGDTTALKYFYIDPVTGEISLKKSIKEDSNTRYSVSTGQGTHSVVMAMVGHSIYLSCE